MSDSRINKQGGAWTRETASSRRSGTRPAQTRAQAEEALGLALLTYPERGLPLPKPRAKGRGLAMVGVAPDVAAKLAVLEAFAAAGIAKSEVGRRMAVMPISA
jgi:antitoxin HicB